ncbi:pentapeptide repeat-containing protein [Rhodococcus qingshengii]|jgi:uncharacterized protein YjbI with pentapeptide repeats|uniref:pentapeptide repeat-containing protein n=1 Tax=Rhodococcus TaxID=1827 RepID=UPI00071803FE|nr:MULTISPECIES: pentapeptide repeat-containing protein [Rhodococcus]MBP1054273.1 pentapeptide repeat-containing protein [Rhodococcus qingshengii]MBP2521074.1 uncharacterized protein YjbI with pentapeptide repeats [Rhodococcus sp. PvP104]MDA3637767.1 pentapeptide repeat-containing protein [Rhodococcus sp. C-2]MYV31829.1 hypothetical protein [Rhodococcus erythropolis]
MAAVTSMETLADEWLADDHVDEPKRLREAQACVDVLCSYLRSPYAPSNREYSLTKRKVTRSEGSVELEEHHDYLLDDLAVRETIVRVIAAHLRTSSSAVPGPHTNLRPGPWSHMNFDLTGAHLHNLNLSACVFVGDAQFQEARFTGKLTTFRNAHFSHPEITSFYGACFASEVTTFRNAHFSVGPTSFYGAHFTGTADFFEANFTGGHTSFFRAHFSGRMTNFRDAHFTGGLTNFRDAHFTSDQTSFVDARFTRRTIFDGSHFMGKVVSFQGARLTGNETTFALAESAYLGWMFDDADLTGVSRMPTGVCGVTNERTVWPVGLHSRPPGWAARGLTPHNSYWRSVLGGSPSSLQVDEIELLDPRRHGPLSDTVPAEEPIRVAD